MNNLILALIESSIALLLFYAVYIFWLQRETLFVENRFYLLFSAGFSLLIPWINYSLPEQSSQTLMVYNLIDTVTITANGYEQSLIQSISNFQWILLVYIAGVSLMLLLFAIKMFRLTRIDKQAELSQSDGLPRNLRFIKADVAPFSFLNKIYINADKYTNSQLAEIVAHEQVHVRQQHSYDCLFYELLTALLWFNPIVYRYRASAKAVHEFLADEGAIRSGISEVEYQMLLLHQATGLNMQPLANSFNYSLTKRRLIMITKIKSSKWTRAKLVFIVPAALVLILVFACNKNMEENEVIAKIDQKAKIDSIEEAVFFVVEKMPAYEGGDQALREFIAMNVIYPKDAKEKGIQGRVFVQFCVDANGKVCDTKVVRGVNESLDAEALRVVSILPNWTPGIQSGKAVKVAFTVPINFQLN